MPFLASISLLIENRCSTAALDGVVVLYLVSKSIKTCSPKNGTSVRTYFKTTSTQVFTKFCTLDIRNLQLLLFQNLGMLLKNSSSSSSLIVVLLQSSLVSIRLVSTMVSMASIILLTLHWPDQVKLRVEDTN